MFVAYLIHIIQAIQRSIISQIELLDKSTSPSMAVGTLIDGDHIPRSERQGRTERGLFEVERVLTLRSNVFIVTGASSGVGKEAAQILYSRNAKVYIASPTESRARDAISLIEAHVSVSQDQLDFLRVDFQDLADAARAARAFLRREARASKQGYERQLGTNTLAPFLFTKRLTSLMA
ncbi:hypothetical protein BP5796_12608 [Coleophoma crateriformis]|uniref:Uncharacterized protein n=1 Tax=Coleophoma crateriformis TaxID=565419 RepID=A0A3D8Q7Y2_9HELO|nr:hypothetical protein BP5796_12608 [Coleophoma crateriformis]